MIGDWCGVKPFGSMQGKVPALRANRSVLSFTSKSHLPGQKCFNNRLSGDEFHESFVIRAMDTICSVRKSLELEKTIST